MKKYSMILFSLLFIYFLGINNLYSDELRIISFNIENGFKPSSDLSTISDEIFSIGAAQLYGFSEVADSLEWYKGLEKAAEIAGEKDFDHIAGTTSSDRLLIVYDTSRLEKIGTKIELKEYQYGSGGRAPLIQKFKDKANDCSFYFMVNHLHRSNSEKRVQQAMGLNQWAITQVTPTIAVGDYNFDFNTPTASKAGADDGYHEMIKNGVWIWVTPDRLVRTQCDRRYDSVLDFAFVSGIARSWERESQILERDPSYCDQANTNDEKMSDHRPIELIIKTESPMQ